MGLFAAMGGRAGVVPIDELKKEYGGLLADGENIEIGFKVVRDTYIFTSKRLIFVDKQGMTGKKTEYKSILYKSIRRFSIETAGHMDLDAELRIWVGSALEPYLVQKFSKKVNIYDVQKVLAQFCG